MMDFSRFNSIYAPTGYFDSETKCRKAVFESRWDKDDVVCPFCGRHHCYVRKDGLFRLPLTWMLPRRQHGTFSTRSGPFSSRMKMLSLKVLWSVMRWKTEEVKKTTGEIYEKTHAYYCCKEGC